MQHIIPHLNKLAKRWLISKDEREAAAIAAIEITNLSETVAIAEARVEQARRVLIAEMNTIDDPEIRKIAKAAVDAIDDYIHPSYKCVGDGMLSTWFGLSYASFLTLPRAVFVAMPDRWKTRLADLLEELDETLPNVPHVKYVVRGQDEKGRMTKIPPELTDYRHVSADTRKKWAGK